MRLSEIYPSIQGEGPNTGKQTLFVRFAGCNLKCPGWPCDSQHAIDPKLYRDEWETITPEALSERIAKELYKLYPSVQDKWICLTGGEPFLQPEKEIVELLDLLDRCWNMKVECFTNATIKWPTAAREHISTFIADWKLPGSGELYNVEAVWLSNLRFLTRRDAIKFTVADRYDFEVAVQRYQKYLEPLYDAMPQVYVGPVWGKSYEAEVAQWILDSGIHNLKLNVQLHNHIWPAHERAR